MNNQNLRAGDAVRVQLENGGRCNGLVQEVVANRALVALLNDRNRWGGRVVGVNLRQLARA